jgi:hypothetical protein
MAGEASPLQAQNGGFGAPSFVPKRRARQDETGNSYVIAASIDVLRSRPTKPCTALVEWLSVGLRMAN